MNPIVFGILAILLVACGFGVILARSAIRSALFLVLTLFYLAVVFLLLDAHLVAALQVIVYAGAIVVLFLFVIMLLNLPHEPGVITRAAARYGSGFLASLFLLALGHFLTGGSAAGPGQGMAQAVSDDFGGTVQIAERLFTQHLFSFEITSFLLLVAIVSAVVLAKKKLV